MTSNWEIKDNVLMIIDDSEGEYIPTAEEIYCFVYKNKNITKFPSLPDTSKTSLTFSKYPLDIFIKIEKSTETLSGISVFFIASLMMLKFKISEIQKRDADHIIHSGVWYPFVNGRLNEIKEILRIAGIKESGEISLSDYLYLRRVSEIYIDDFSIKNDVDAQQISEKVSQAEPGHLFSASLYPFQKKGFSWLKFMIDQGLGCILADEMGLGKTIQIIALISSRSESEKPALIIAPATLLENWRREFLKFAPELLTMIHRGSNRTGLPSELKGMQAVITSYETAVRDIYLLNMIDWDLVILDEAQAVKNSEAKRTKKINNIRRRSAIAVTGTPIQNRLTDLWSLIDIVLPGYLGRINDFLHTYPPDNLDAAKDLESRVSPLILRRTVESVALDLPQRIDIPQYLEMDKKYAKIYDQIRQKIKDSFSPGGSLALLTKLRMFCTHPFLITGDIGDYVESSTKYMRLLEILEEIIISNEKALIFTSYTRMIDILMDDINARLGVNTCYLDGRVKVERRQDIIDDFNNLNKPSVLVLNPQAGGVGLNITGANHVIHYNPEWNPAIEDQATARAYRKGQTRPVMVHRLIYSKTIEEVIDNRLERKRRLAGNAIVGVNGNHIDRDDLLAALNITPINKV